MSRSGLPDNVFDLGERPAKLVHRRVKVGFFLKNGADNLDRSLNCVKQESEQVKKCIIRYTKQTPTVCPYELVYHILIYSFTYLSFYSSSQSTSDMALKLTENSLSETNLPAVVETFVSKDWSDKKAPHLPFGENVAVATAANAAQ